MSLSYKCFVCMLPNVNWCVIECRTFYKFLFVLKSITLFDFYDFFTDDKQHCNISKIENRIDIKILCLRYKQSIPYYRTGTGNRTYIHNLKITIPEVIKIVIFEFLVLRAFKRVPSLWVYLNFSIF